MLSRGMGGSGTDRKNFIFVGHKFDCWLIYVNMSFPVVEYLHIYCLESASYNLLSYPVKIPKLWMFKNIPSCFLCQIQNLVAKMLGIWVFDDFGCLKSVNFIQLKHTAGVGLRSPGSVHVEMGELRGWDGRLMAGGYKKTSKASGKHRKKHEKNDGTSWRSQFYGWVNPLFLWAIFNSVFVCLPEGLLVNEQC